MDDVQIDNRLFTWSNKREQPTLVRLDRVLVNAAWNLSFLQSTVSCIPTTASDHAPLLLSFSTNTPRSKLFRIENHWLEMAEPCNIISQAWSRGTREISSAASLISFKMRRVRAALRQWCRSKPRLRILVDNNKHVVPYLNAVEELRPLSSIETELGVSAAAKAEQLILW